MIDETEQIQPGRTMVRLIEAATLLLPDADQHEADLVRRRARAITNRGTLMIPTAVTHNAALGSQRQSLLTQSIQLTQLTELGTNWIEALSSEQPPLRVTGYAYAFRLAPFLKSSTDGGLGWHMQLLQRTILGLHTQRSRQSLVVGYQLLAQFIRVVVCARRTTTWPKFGRLMTALPGYLEAGYDSVPVTALRYIACWSPPDQAVALWPTGLAGETDGLRVVDTGNLMGYFSAEVEADLLPTLDPHDYVVVPAKRASMIQWHNRLYAYQNRWLALTV